MARITIASLNTRIEQLTAENNALTTECDRLRRQLRTAEAAEQYQAARVRHAAARGARPVYEFDPSIADDFSRAANLARANGGTVVRAQRSAH